MTIHCVWHFNDADRPADAIYIGRAMPRYGLAESVWHNPFTLASIRRRRPLWTAHSVRAAVLRGFERYAEETIQRVSWHWLDPLIGHDLACWCAKKGHPLTADDPLVCHGQVLLRLLREREGA